MAASSVCSAVIMEPALPSLCCVEMFPLAFDKKSPLCNLVHLLCPSCFFQHADFMPASLRSRFCLARPPAHEFALPRCPSSAAAMLRGDKEEALLRAGSSVFSLSLLNIYINDLLFVSCKHKGDKQRFDRGHSNPEAFSNASTLTGKCFLSALTSIGTCTSGNSAVTFICFTKPIKFEQSFTHAAEANAKYVGKLLK